MSPGFDSNTSDDFDQGQIVVRGGTDNTKIGNSGDRLKTIVASEYTTFVGSAGSLNADLIASTDVAGYSACVVQVLGTWVGTLTVQGSNDNSTFVSILNINTASPVTAPATSITANGIYFIPLFTKYLRVRMTAYTSGTATSSSLLETLNPQDLGTRRNSIISGNNIAGVSSNLDLTVSDTLNHSGVQGAVTVTTTATAANVSGSNLADRKRLTILNNSSVTLYWGFTSGVTTSTGTPLPPTQLISDAWGPNTTIYLIAASGSREIRVTEAA